MMADVAIMAGGSNVAGKGGAGGESVELGGAETRVDTDGKGVGAGGTGIEATGRELVGLPESSPEI